MKVRSLTGPKNGGLGIERQQKEITAITRLFEVGKCRAGFGAPLQARLIGI